MANISGTSVVAKSSVLDSPSLEIAGAKDIEIVEINGTTFAYVLGSADDGVQVFSLSGSGTLTPVTALKDTAATALVDGSDMITFAVGSSQFLAVTGQAESGLSVFRLTDTAPFLIPTGSVFQSDDIDYKFANTSAVTAVEWDAPQRTFLYVGGLGDAFSPDFGQVGVSVFDVDVNGVLTHVTDITSSPGGVLESLSDLVTVKVGPSQFVLATSQNGVIARYNPDINGNLVFSSQGAIGFGKSALAATEIGGLGVAFVTSEGDDSVSVIQFSGFLTFKTLQTIQSRSALDGATRPEIVEIGDRTFLLVSTLNTGTVEIFEIDTDPLSSTKGGLTPVQQISDVDILLDGPSAAALANIGGQPFILVADGAADRIAVLSLGDDDDVLEGTRFADRIDGFAGDDIIFGLGGADDIFGGAGDDTINGGGDNDDIFAGDGNDTVDGGQGFDEIHGGAGDDILNGGADADLLFGEDGDDVIYGGSGPDTIALSAGVDATYGGSDTDLLDASGYTPVGSGITIDFIRNEVVLDDGTIQFVIGVENANGTALNDTLVGTDGDNVIQGGEGDDLIRGRSGDDTLSGNGGDDQLVGANGNDDLRGGLGADRISGGNGDDVMEGGAGDDRMFGGNDNDTMNGGGDDDLLKGNDGNDEVVGGSGDDRIEGNQGDDFLRGNAGNDTIIGGGGRDRINGGAGNDLLTGGSAADEFVFLAVANGGGGNNVITDFQDGLDKLDVSDYAFGFLIRDSATQFFTDVRMTAGDGQVIILKDFLLADLDSSDFFL